MHLLCWLVLIKTAAFAQAPGWAVNPAAFTNSMNMTAQVHLDGAEENGGDNLLAAFVGNEVRGVASPQIIGGKAYYFLTMYSNTYVGETMHFQVYLSSPNTVHIALEEFAFLKNTQEGGYPTGYPINISPDNDFPISLLPRMPDSTLTVYPFQGIELDSLLVTQDNDPVSWTKVNGTHLTATIGTGNMLSITLFDPMWTGTDSVEVTATETGTPNSYSASQYLHFTVQENYDAPVFGNFPFQYVQGNLPPPSGDLNEYLGFDGPCLDYHYELLLPQGDQAMPNWVQPGGNSGSMSMVVEVGFGGQPFTGLSHRLAGYVGGDIVGVADPILIQGKALYFLTLSNINEGEIIFRFYDSGHNYLYQKPRGIDFEAAASIGDVVSPFNIDLAPVAVSISLSGEWASVIVDSNWVGQQQVRFFAEDCKYVDKADSTDVFFVFNQCSEQTVSLPVGEGLCFQADAIVGDVKWYRDGNEVDTGYFLSAFETGAYQYEGLTPNDCPDIKSCPVLVTGVAGHPIPTGTSPPLPSMWPSPPFCGPVSFTDITIDDTPPTASCKDYTVDLDSNGAALLQLTDMDNGSFTSCGEAGISLSVNTFSCNDVGMNMVVLTIEDAAGRKDSCTAMVTVEDNILPTVLCRDSVFQVSPDGSLSILPSDVLQGSSDNCGPVSIIGVSPNTFDCGQRGNHSVALTVEDSNGNTNTCTSIVTVDDSLFPCCPPTNIVYVNENTADDDDGSDWDNAFATLDRAFELASRCPIITEVWVAGGTYFPTSGTDRTVSFHLQNGVAVNGGFSGTETVFADRDVVANETVLSGDIGTLGDSTGNSYHVVSNIGGGINSTAILDGFSVSGRYADGIGNDEKGGGIINRNTSPTIRHCTLLNNFASEQGGGIYNYYASPNVDSCRFVSNWAKTGGGSYNSICPGGGFDGCTFHGNSASMTGGAMLNSSVNFTVTNSLFIENTASGDGGPLPISVRRLLS